MTNSYRLRFANNVIEHLGVKLYQNKPTNVVAEYVANGWDAGAVTVDIDLHREKDGNTIVITDDGEGMTVEELKDRFLIIGINRRRMSKSVCAAKGRLAMGRKGIGKLAGFGIAKRIDVITCSKKSDKAIQFHWLRFDLDKILNESQSGDSVDYEPEVVGEEEPSKFREVLKKSGIKSEFISRFEKNLLEGNSGTSIVLQNVRLADNFSEDRLKKGIEDRFALNLIKEDMTLRFNGEILTGNKRFQNLQEFYIGKPNELKEDYVEVDGIKKIVKYWIGFVKLSKGIPWSIDDAGIAVYAHNKIVQGRPFYFSTVGKEIYSRYIIGFVYADWLDDVETDLVSTDRNSINWDDPLAAALMRWGQKKMGEWTSSYQEYRNALLDKEIDKDVKESNIYGSVSAAETDALKGLLRQIYPGLNNDRELQQKACKVMADAWVRRPMRETLKNLWASIGNSNMLEPQIQTFLKIVKQLRNCLMPELLDLGVTAAMRLDAVRQMRTIVNKGATETHLQRLIEDFPWLLKPNWECLTANQTIRTVVEKIDESPNEEQIENGSRRPDFVYLSDLNEKKIAVIELKGAEYNKTLQPKEYYQLGQYINEIALAYPDSEIEGLLIGHDISGISKNQQRRNDIRLASWQEILKEAEILNLDILKTVLLSDIDRKDSRLNIISEFTGEKLNELLEHLRSNGYMKSKDYAGETPFRKNT